MDTIKSSKDSNLTSYGYDMVTATTQDSINATLKQYLYKMDSTEYVVAYSLTYDENGNCSIDVMDYNNLVENIGIDLFTITSEQKDRTPEENMAIDKAYDEFDFYMAIKGSIGIDSLECSLPDIVTLIESDISSQANVLYKAYFNNLEIISLNEHKRIVYFNHIIQPKDNPYFFNFNVKLDFKHDEFNSLPENIQKQIKNLDPATMFSIQQLYLDLNSAKLQSCPTIEGVAIGTNEYDLLNRFFIETYWNGLKNSDSGDVIFGYTVSPSGNNINPNYVITPTDFTFYISTYIDPKTKEKKPGLNTLNYVVMSNNHPLPSIKPFTWNWLEADEKLDKHGSIAINRNEFVKKLADQLFIPLKYLLLQPKVSIKKHFSSYDITYGIEQYKGDLQPLTLTDSGSEIIKYSFYTKAADDDTYGLIDKASFSIDYNLNYSVKLNSNKIEVTALIDTNLNLDAGLGVKNSKCKIVSYKLVDTYTLLVNSSGELIFNYAHNDSKEKGHYDSNWWKEHMLPGHDELIDKICTKYDSWIDKYHNNYDKKMLTCLSSSLNWVFPGNDSFVFKNVAFSNFQDLIVDITYVQ